MSRALCSLSFMYAARALFARAKRCSLSYTYVISSEMQRCSTQRSLINTHRLSIGLHIRPPRMFQGDRQMLGVSISLRLHYSDLTPDKTSILGGGMVFNVLYTAWPTKFLQILPIRQVRSRPSLVFLTPSRCRQNHWRNPSLTLWWSYDVAD